MYNALFAGLDANIVGANLSYIIGIASAGHIAVFIKLLIRIIDCNINQMIALPVLSGLFSGLINLLNINSNGNAAVLFGYGLAAPISIGAGIVSGCKSRHCEQADHANYCQRNKKLFHVLSSICLVLLYFIIRAGTSKCTKLS